MATKESLLTRFWNRVQQQEDGCWLWTGARDANGYGKLYVGIFRGRQMNMLAHRYSYFVFVGGTSKELDHLCRNSSCVNPDHLEAVDHKTNCSRGRAGWVNREKSACQWGHPLTPSNVRLYHDNQGYTRRMCIECERRRTRHYRRRQLRSENKKQRGYRRED